MLHDQKINLAGLTFTNSMLQELSNSLLKDGFRVYVFQTERVSQIFFEAGDGAGIGTCYDRYGYLAYSTVHIPNRQTGTGFILVAESTDTTTETAGRTCRTYRPSWGSGDLIKWSSFKAKASKCSLTYHELTNTTEEN